MTPLSGPHPRTGQCACSTPESTTSCSVCRLRGNNCTQAHIEGVMLADDLGWPHTQETVGAAHTGFTSGVPGVAPDIGQHLTYLEEQRATSLEDSLTGPSSSLNVDQHVSATVKGKSCSTAQPFRRKHTVTQTQSHGQGHSLGNAGISDSPADTAYAHTPTATNSMWQHVDHSPVASAQESDLLQRPLKSRKVSLQQPAAELALQLRSPQEDQAPSGSMTPAKPQSNCSESECRLVHKLHSLLITPSFKEPVRHDNKYRNEANAESMASEPAQRLLEHSRAWLGSCPSDTCTYSNTTKKTKLYTDHLAAKVNGGQGQNTCLHQYLQNVHNEGQAACKACPVGSECPLQAMLQINPPKPFTRYGPDATAAQQAATPPTALPQGDRLLLSVPCGNNQFMEVHTAQWPTQPTRGPLIVFSEGQTEATFAFVAIDSTQHIAQMVNPLCRISLRRGCTLVFIDGLEMTDDQAKAKLISLVDTVAHSVAAGSTLSYRNKLYRLLPSGQVEVVQGSTGGIVSAELTAHLKSVHTSADSGNNQRAAKPEAKRVFFRQLHVELQNVSAGDQIRLHFSNSVQTVTLPATQPGISLESGVTTKLSFDLPPNFNTVEFVEHVAATGLTSGRIHVTNMLKRQLSPDAQDSSQCSHTAAALHKRSEPCAAKDVDQHVRKRSAHPEGLQSQSRRKSLPRQHQTSVAWCDDRKACRVQDNDVEWGEWISGSDCEEPPEEHFEKASTAADCMAQQHTDSTQQVAGADAQELPSPAELPFRSCFSPRSHSLQAEGKRHKDETKCEADGAQKPTIDTQLHTAYSKKASLRAAQQVGRMSAADHTVYHHEECCMGQCQLDSNTFGNPSGVPSALLPKELQRHHVQGRLMWGAAYPVMENRLGLDGEYKKCLDFQRKQFEKEAHIELPGIKDVLQTVAYSSAGQLQTSKSKPWARCDGTSTSGQFTLWHEPLYRVRPKKTLVSSLVFHLREKPAPSMHAQTSAGGRHAIQHEHAVVEIMFVSTDVAYRNKKFFVQLLRLFMREYLLKHYKHVDMLVMADARSAAKWAGPRLAKHLGTQTFKPIDKDHYLVEDRMKCQDCTWLHLAISQGLFATAE